MNIFLDMDNTIADSQKAFINTYCIKKGLPFTQDYTERWDFSDIFPNITKEETIDIFISDLYFRLLRPIENASETVKAMTYFGDTVYIVSLCHPKIVQKKIEWLNKYFPTANFIPIISHVHDKSIINMKDGIFVDDRPDVLLGSNASEKILFKCMGNCDWQQKWDGKLINSWEIRDFHDIS